MVIDLVKKISWAPILIVIVTIIKSLVWTSSVPLWHAPDEAAHFSTIQNYAENIDLTKIPSGYGASRELQISEQFLETERGDDGTTPFTFRPDYKIQYAQGRTGIHEEEIKMIPQELREQPVRHEQAYYPPLYYRIGQTIYDLAYNQDVIQRAFAIRLFSILTFGGIVIISFLLAKEIFPEQKYMHLTVPLVVSFHPMLTFSSVGINSDNLANFNFSLFLLFGVYAIIRGLDMKKAAILGVVIGLGFFIKPQFIIAFALSLMLIFYELLRTRNFFLFLKNGGVFLFISLLSGGFIPIQEALANLRESGKALPYVETGSLENSQKNLSFFKHLENTIRQTIAQTLPWYWGVFKWLSLTLPRIVNQILMRIVLIGAIGLVFKFLVEVRHRNFSRVNQALLFLAFTAVFFFFAIIFRDFQHVRSHIFSLGIQGRYFFPVITAHLVLLLVGLLALIPERFKKTGAFILILGSVVLNFVALHTLISSSYNLTSLTTIVNEMSQYKPPYFKGEMLLSLFGLYFLSVVAMIIFTLRSFLRETS